MFFHRLVERAGSDWNDIQGTLERPRGGRYVSFSNYPSPTTTADGAGRQKLYRQVGLCEAVRRLAREDFDVLASSTLGRVISLWWAMPTPPCSKCLTSIQGRARRLVVTAKELGADSVRIEFVPNFAAGVSGRPARGHRARVRQISSVRVALLPERHLRIDITHN
jgi:hypothetical protein